MFSFPRIPLQILFLDSLKGKREQLYLDSNGQHQYYKELDFIRKVQLFCANKKDSYIKAGNGNYNPIKLNNYLNKITLDNFGYSLILEDVRLIYGN